jgi:hypothetical protein
MLLHRRSVRVQLRGGRSFVGIIHIAEGQSLAGFLSSKPHFVNITGVRWEDAPAQGALPHLSVRRGQIVWVEPLEAELRLTSAIVPPEDSREIELHVDGGVRLQVRMSVARETRMSDYLDANPSFIPLWSVRVTGRDHVVDRIALNHDAIHDVRELEGEPDRLSEVAGAQRADQRR